MTRVLSTLFVVASLGGQSARVGDITFLNSGSAAARAPFIYGLAQLQLRRHLDEMSQLHGAYPEDVDASAFHIGSPEQDPLDPDNIPAASYVHMWARYVIDTGEFVDPAAQDEIALGTWWAQGSR